MAKELQVKEFSALPFADDGKTLLYTDGAVHQSRLNLSEMVDEKLGDKLDTTAFSTVSGNFLTAHQVIPSAKWENVSDVVITNSAIWGTETDWTDEINAASAYAYEKAVEQIPASFDPTYLSGEIDKKLDTSIYAADSATFLTAHQDLSDYVTNNTYQTTTNYLSGAIDYVSANSNDILYVHAVPGRDTTLDTSYYTISSAINAGKTVIVIPYDGQGYYYYNSQEPGNNIFFTRTSVPTYNHSVNVGEIYIKNTSAENPIVYTHSVSINADNIDSVYNTVNTNSANWGSGGQSENDIFIITPTTTQKEIADNSGKAIFYKDNDGVIYPPTEIDDTNPNNVKYEFKGLKDDSTVNQIDFNVNPLTTDPINVTETSSTYLIIGTNYYTSVPLNVSGIYTYNGTSYVQEPKHGGEFTTIKLSGEGFEVDIKSNYYNPTVPERSAARPLIVNGSEVQWVTEHNEYHIHLTINGITTIDHNEPPQNASIGCGAASYSNDQYGLLFYTSNAVVYNMKYYNGLTFTATDNSEIELYCVNSKNRHYIAKYEFCYETWYGGPFTINEPIYIPTYANNEEKDQGYFYNHPEEGSGENCEVNWKLTPVTSYDTGYVLTAAPDAITGLKINDRIYRFPSNNFTYRNI